MSNLENELISWLKNNNIEFKNIEIYKIAVTHPSLIGCKNYQQLEFFGDSILNLYVTKLIFNKFSKSTEGDMSSIRINTVNKDTQAIFSDKLGLTKLIQFGKSFDISNINNKNKIRCYWSHNCCNIYRCWWSFFKRIFRKNIFLIILKNTKDISSKDPKTKLQELLQSESRGNIVYESKN